MIVLGTWAGLNIITGSAGYFVSEGNTRYFHQMNAAWNLVNLGIAGFATYNILQTDPSALSYSEMLNDANSLDRFLLLNTGLDVGYMATGAWLWERGLRKNSDRLEGYGQSLVLQGAFLFVFDLLFYAIHHPVTQDLLKLNQNLELTASGFKIHF